jgi:hypothetical protein
MDDTKAVRITRLIAIPAVITLGVTILRLVGELAHWPSLFFSTAPGGGLAVVGISWLPIIFGPYFALKLANAGSGPASTGKALSLAGVGLLVFVLGAVNFATTAAHPSYLTLAGLVLMLASAFVPGIGWKSLGTALLAYAFAARIPVLIVMYFTMTANGGAGAGTHYDKVAPPLAHLPFASKFFYAAIVPQMTLWIGWTVVLGALVGTIVTAVARPKKDAAPAAA